jgi:hypothetical protein
MHPYVAGLSHGAHLPPSTRLLSSSIDFRDKNSKIIDNDIVFDNQDCMTNVQPLIDKHFPLGRFPTQADKQVIEERQLGHKVNRMIVVSKNTCKHGFAQAFIQKPIKNQQVHSGMVTADLIIIYRLYSL